MATAELISREDNIARLRVTFGPEEVDRCFSAVYRELGKSIKIDGFRKGKIPPAVIKQRVGAAAIAEAAGDDLKREAVGVALEELKLSARGDVRWQSDPDPTEGQASTYEFSLPVLPEVTLPDYRAYELTVPVLSITDETKDRFRQRMIERFTKYPEKEGAATGGDAVVLSFTSTDPQSGEATPLGANDLSLIIGAEGNFPGWDEQLSGLAAGGEREFDFTVPPDFSDPRVAGKPVRVSLSVKSVHDVEPPTLDEAFIKEHLHLDSQEEFDQYIETTLVRERDQHVQQMKSELVLQKLTAELDAQLSEDMINDELDGLVKDYDQQLRRNDSSLEQFLKEQQRTLKEYRDSLREGAIQKIRVFLTVKAIAEAEQLRTSQEDFQRYAMYLMQYEGVPAEQMKELLRNEGFLREATYQILREKVLAHLAGSAKFNEEEAVDGEAPAAEAGAAAEAASEPAAESEAAPEAEPEGGGEPAE